VSVRCVLSQAQSIVQLATSDLTASPTATKYSADTTVPNMFFCHLLDVLIFSPTLKLF
jgi:hypothetical protein